MKPVSLRFRCLGALACLAPIGCSNLEPTVDPGTLIVTVSTAGADPPVSAYLVEVRGETAEVVSKATVGRVVFDHLSPGPRTVTLAPLPANCDLGPSPSQLVQVASGETATVAFAVTCFATGIRIEVHAAGLDLDLDYRILLNGVDRGTVSGPFGLVTRLTPGSYRLLLGDIAPNCRLDAAGPGAPIDVTVTSRQVSVVRIGASCAARTGVVLVRVATSGDDRDANGYDVVGGRRTPRIGLDGEVAVVEVPGGDPVIRLDGVARNCRVIDGESRTVHVMVGGMTRDTVAADFEVTCERSWGIALSRSGEVGAVSADGSLLDTFAAGDAPSWAPDGRRLAYRCANEPSICLLSFDGQTVRLPIPADGPATTLSPSAWRPDGEALVVFSFSPTPYPWDFDVYTTLYIAEVTGAAPTPIPLPAGFVGGENVSWSPDGTRLVFDCWMLDEDTSDLCSVGADGSGFFRLTGGLASHRDPSWSPDGARIVFATDRWLEGTFELATIAPDGRGIVRLGVVGDSPAWSPDGQHIVFSRDGAFATAGLYVVAADGTGPTRLTFGPDLQPSWRP